VRLAIAGDHNAVGMKQYLTHWLEDAGHQVSDLGTESAEVVDYPPLCIAVGEFVTSGRADLGVVLGGSGQGEAIVCNKLRGIRAGLCHSVFAAQISRGHNDANVLVMGSKIVSDAEAQTILATWLTTQFKGGRHQDRVDQINQLDAGRASGS
jgi:ribose 5-phosphate isomerase B